MAKADASIASGMPGSPKAVPAERSHQPRNTSPRPTSHPLPPGEKRISNQLSEQSPGTGLGLVHLHIVEPDEDRRLSLHGTLSKRRDAVIRSYKTAADFLNQRQNLEGGCILLALDHDGDAILEFLYAVQSDQHFATVVISSLNDVRLAVEAMKAGATDYLLRPVTRSELWDAIGISVDRVAHFMAADAMTLTARQRIARLSARERDVLCGLVEGKSNKMIANELQISPRTIEIYRAHLMDKLGVRTLSEVLKFAFAAGIENIRPNP